jgi:hypothetical protein
MTHWSQLTHAYGSAEDIPDLLSQVAPGPRSQAWSELWSRLCHQGTIYSASHAALPALTQLARQWPPTDRADPLVLAGAIVASTHQPYGEPDPHVTYATEIAELIALTEEALQHPDLAEDPSTYVELLGSLLAFEGVEVWGEQLDGLIGEEFELPCPQCEAENFIVFGQHGYFSTIDDMYMNNTSSKRTPLRPADPSALEGLPRRLHARTLAEGHPDLANKLTYVFGDAKCADCDTPFRVDEAVVARWG